MPSSVTSASQPSSVGNDPASHIYIDLKQKAAQATGMEARDLKLPADTSEDDLLATIAALNADDDIDGLLVQLPLPDHIDETRVDRGDLAAKDVDGIHPVNAGRLYLGRPTLVPGTPLGIMRMLDEYEIPLEGARSVVVGRSAIVGKPMAHPVPLGDESVRVRGEIGLVGDLLAAPHVDAARHARHDDGAGCHITLRRAGGERGDVVRVVGQLEVGVVQRRRHHDAGALGEDAEQQARGVE